MIMYVYWWVKWLYTLVFVALGADVEGLGGERHLKIHADSVQ